MVLPKLNMGRCEGIHTEADMKIQVYLLIQTQVTTKVKFFSFNLEKLAIIKSPSYVTIGFLFIF